jgi:Bifunctional DNA primase/polymerase, N-terminal
MTALPWWRTENYSDAIGLPGSIDDLAGPNGTALVRVWPDGRTDSGWGLTSPKGDGFMAKYLRNEFNPRRIVYGYDRGKWAFAFVMRSVRLVCIDIDGKNGGLDHAKHLGMLPPTLAETSKSGDGYHLWYRYEEQWDHSTGFGSINDRISLEQGVDLRAVGCVYHYQQQRWNGRPVADLPDHLLQMLTARQQKLASATSRIEKVLANNDELEVLMLHDEIIADLKKPIDQGKRNTTLFAIGAQMQQAEVPGWEDLLKDRAIEVGLPADETLKIIANIERYGKS